jgi:hypothetical protein
MSGAFNRLVLPLVGAAVLGGCATDDYYRTESLNGNGDLYSSNTAETRARREY